MSYKTIIGSGSAEFIERKSQFIGHIAHVTTASQATEFIEKIAKQHYNATHNVYAYSLLNGVYRYSDDGEPQGTAGIPVLDVLKKEGIFDACIVATRYFGGILLGGGGLVRAYSHTATIAIAACEVKTMEMCCNVRICCDYSLHGKISYILPQFGVTMIASDFTDIVTLTLQIKKCDYDRFCGEIVNLSDGKVTPEVVSEEFA